MSNDAVADQSALPQRSFDSNDSSPSNGSRGKYVSLSEFKQSVEADVDHKKENTGQDETKVLYKVVDLDDDVSSDDSETKSNLKCSETKIETNIETPCAESIEKECSTIEPSTELILWSHITQNYMEELNFHSTIQDDDRTQGSDNSKCSFGYEKPKITQKLLPIAPETMDMQLIDQPVLDKIPSKVGNHMLDEHDNATCTCSDSESSTIPSIIYIRRDMSNIVPEEETLEYHYDALPDRIKAYSNTSSEISSSIIMKGLRFLSLGAIGTNKTNKSASTNTGSNKATRKMPLDDDVSEIFQQVLIDI
jgi:hypothetical protein